MLSRIRAILYRPMCWGAFLGLAILGTDLAITKWSRWHIIHRIEQGALRSDRFNAFQLDLLFHFDGDPVFPVVFPHNSSLLQSEFPDYDFVRVVIPPAYFGLWSASSSYHEEIWAVSRMGEPNWCFSSNDSAIANFIQFLSCTNRAVETQDDAEVLRRIAFELTGFSEMRESAETHRRHSSAIWEIVGSRSGESVWVLRISLDANGVVESGMILSQRSR